MAPHTPSEKSIVDAITRYLDRIGAYWIKTHGSQYGRAGVPDLIVCFEGWFYAFEVKRPKVGRVHPLQAIEIQKIGNADGRAHVVRSVNEVRAIMGA